MLTFPERVNKKNSNDNLLIHSDLLNNCKKNLNMKFYCNDYNKPKIH
jgi:hypothetical protein